MRRLLLVLCGLLLVANLVVVTAEPEGRVASADDPTLAPSTTTSTTTSTMTTVVVVAPTTTVATTPVVVRASQPINPPKNPYQAERYTVVGSIEIPKLGLRAPIGEGIALSTIDRGPSHWPGSAMPGQVGNVVIAGHRVTHSRPFRNIDQLVPGDEVIFEVGGQRWTYRMTSHEVVTPDQTRIAKQTPTPTATLFACHPPGSARYRYVVYLALVT